MAKPTSESQALGDLAARQLANATPTVPQLATITPRWLLQLIAWVPVKAGVYRVNRVVDPERVAVKVAPVGDEPLPQTHVDYETAPREYLLRPVSTILQVHTRVADLYSSPHDQVTEQLRLTIETVRESQEEQLVTHPEFGLLANVAEGQTLAPRYGPPTPDDLDALIAKVWKQPAFFLAHPLAVAAFGREATRRGVPPATVTLFGSPFLTWRGIPIIPSDKVPVVDGATSFLLLRTGEDRRGVVGLFKPGLQGEQSPGLSVRFAGISDAAVASYLVSLYTSLAVLTDDALAVLEGVRVDHFHDYA